MSDSDDETPSEKVRKTLAGRRPVTDETVVDLAAARKARAAKPKAGAVKRPRAKKPPSAPPADEPPVGDDGQSGEVEPLHGDDDPPPSGTTPDELEKARQCRDLDQNDLGNARRLIIWCGADLIYVSGMGWLTWRGTHWQRDEGDLGARLHAHSIVERIKLEAALLEATPAQQRALDAAATVNKKPEADWTPSDHAVSLRAAKILEGLSKRRSDRKKFAVSTGNAAKTSAMLVQAASLKNTIGDALDVDLKAFNVRNGTLVFERVENPDSDPDSPTFSWQVKLRPHERTDLITKLAEVDYDPAAKCPRFDAFLDRVQPHEVVRLSLMVVHGYMMLLGGNDEQRLIFHYGTGANGKSVFMETMGRMAGSYGAVMSPDTITGDGQKEGSKASGDIARLHSARVVTVEELARGIPLRDNLIKSLTGGGRQVARFNFKEFFEFQPVFTPMMSGNDLPSVSGADGGVFRRLIIYHWAIKIPEAERIPFGTMLRQLEEERSGILNWLIAGALRYLNEGLEKFIPDEVRQFTEDYREERDPVGTFVEACVLRGEGFEHLKVGAAAMYRAYIDWREANAIKPYQMTAFGLRLNALGLAKKRGHNVYYLGCWLRDGGSEPPMNDPADPGWQPG